MGIRGKNTHPKSPLQLSDQEYATPIGIQTTAGTYYIATLAISGAYDTAGNTIYAGNAATRQNTNLYLTMVLGTGTGITFVITIIGYNQFGDWVTEDVTVTDAALGQSTLYCYSRIVSVKTKSFAGTVGTSSISLGYGNTGGTIITGANGFRIALPAKGLVAADVLGLRIGSAALVASELTWTFVGAPYHCMSAAAGGALSSNPGTMAMIRLAGKL